MTYREAMADFSDHVNLCPDCRAAVDPYDKRLYFSGMCDRARELVEEAYRNYAGDYRDRQKYRR